MKRYLTMFMALIVAFALASCGGTQESNSEPSSNISEQITEEMITIDTTTLKEATIETDSKQFTFGNISFILPDSCMEEVQRVTEGEAVNYDFSDSSRLSIKKSPDYTGLSTDYNDDTIKEVLIILTSSLFEDMSSAFEEGDFEVLGEPEELEINGNLAVKQEAVTNGVFSFHFSIYGFICGDNIYTFCFSDGTGIDAYTMQYDIINSISFL